MLEILISPQKAERRPWELFFIGIFYASISILMVNWIFSKDAVLAGYSGILVITFTVIFSIPFMYYMIKFEEEKIVEGKGMLKILKEHERALWAFLWLFMGFVVAFAFWYALLPTTERFIAQIETYCLLNRSGNFDKCVAQSGVKGTCAT